MTYKATGFIISKRFSREHDCIFVLYTKEYGKIEALAQGVLKSESKLAGNLELLIKASFLLARGRVLDRVAGIDVQERFFDIKKNIQKLIIALSRIEIVHTLVQGKVADAHLFSLMEDFFTELENLSEKSETRKAITLANLFTIKLSLVLGYRSDSRAAKQFLNRLSTCGLGQFLNASFPPFISALAGEFLSQQLSRRLNSQPFLDLLAKEVLNKV